MKADKHCKGGIFKTPLQSLSSLSVEKNARENFPLLSPFKNCCVAFVSVETARTNIVKRSILSPLVKVCPCFFLYELFQILLVETRQRETELFLFTLYRCIAEYGRVALDMGFEKIKLAAGLG